MDNLNNLGGLVSRSAQQEADLPNMLREALTAKFTKDSPLIRERNSAVQNLLNVNSTSGEFAAPRSVTIGGGQEVAPGANPVGEQATVDNVHLPFSSQQRIMSARRGAALTPVMTLNDILGATTGGINNIISDTEKAYSAQTKRRQADYDIAKDLEDLRIKEKAVDAKGKSLKLSPTQETAYSTTNSLLGLVRNAKSTLTGDETLQNPWDVSDKFAGLKVGLNMGNSRDKTLVGLNKTIQNILATVAKERGGTSFTPNEQQILESYAPKGGKSRQETLLSLENLENFLVEKNLGLVNTAQSSQEGDVESLIMDALGL